MLNKKEKVTSDINEFPGRLLVDLSKVTKPFVDHAASGALYALRFAGVPAAWQGYPERMQIGAEQDL